MKIVYKRVSEEKYGKICNFIKFIDKLQIFPTKVFNYSTSWISTSLFSPYDKISTFYGKKIVYRRQDENGQYKYYVIKELL